MPLISRLASAAARAYGMFAAVSAAVDPFFNYVTALLHGDGTNGAQNNTFLDSSTNNFTITRNGNTTQGTFSPFSQTGWSSYIDESSQYVSYGSSADFTFGTGDFTVEAWVYVSSVAASNLFNVFNVGNNTAGSYSMYVRADGKIESVRYGDAAGSGVSTGTINFNSWNHLAAVRSGGTAKLYINGTADSGATYSMGNITASAGETGRVWQTAYTSTGYVSNLRVCKGTAVYTANFTPSTTPLTSTSQSASNCVLLTFQSNRFVDTNTATTAKTITLSGTPSIQAFSPFNPTSAWSASSNGGSGYFDGSGDYLQNTSVTNQFDVGSAFTLEMWAYVTTYGFDVGWFNVGGSTVNWNATTGLYISLYYYSNNLYWQTGNGSGSAISMITTAAPPANSWCHVAIGYNGTTTRMWINGTSVGTSTSAYAKPSGTDRFQVGAFTGGGSPYSGYLSNVRFVKGTDVYGVGNTSITVPTAPLTAITNTSLLLSATNAGIYDNAAVGDYETVGNAQVSTSVFKYGTGSMAFDGTGDYLFVGGQMQPYTFGTSDFTIEFWMYLNAAPGAGNFAIVYDLRPASTQGIYPVIYIDGANSTLKYWINSADVITGSNLSNSTWYHVAVSKIASQTKMFVNGTQVGSTYTDTNSYLASRLVIGASAYTLGAQAFNGYLDDLRITKGVGRYQYNFTPPTAAFPNIGGTVTLTADPYYNYTTLLLPGNGTNGAQNNTFLDSSSNAFTITRNGNTTQGNFSPFSQTGWSNYFDGTGDYLTVTGSSNLAFGTGDFTVEGWFYPTTDSGSLTYRALYDSLGASAGTTTAIRIYYYNNTLMFTDYTTTRISGGTPTLNSWNHFALARSGTSTKLFLNGTQVGSTYTDSNSYVNGTTRPTIGGSGYTVGTEMFIGYISNVRALKGTAQYTANFTPPTSPLTAITNTQLLTCQNNRFIDNSSNAYTITSYGDASVQAFSPFAPTAAWSASTNGGSGYFDGSGDYLVGPNNAAFNFGTGDFCVEFWIYPSDLTFRIYFSSADNASTQIGYDPGNGPRYLYFYNGSNIFSGQTAGFLANQWNHVALCRSGTTLSMYCNGTRAYTNAAYSSNISFTTPYVGEYNALGYPTLGYISNLRLVKGASVYTPSSSTLTVPTAPLTAIANTSLLLNMTNGGIVDATAKNDLETVGNAQISTTQSKFGGSSMSFNGTNSNLLGPTSQNTVFNGDFTVEFWVYKNADKNYNVYFDNRATVASANGFSIASDSAGKFGLFTNNAFAITSANAYATATWFHIAAVRYGSTITLYVNGISVGTATNSTAFTDGRLGVGYSLPDAAQYANAYIDDLRVTKGIARYTSNFTPPTSAFLLQ